MKKFIAIVCFIFLILFCNSNLFAQIGDAKNMKNWELKGYGQYAVKIGDTYAAINFYNVLLERKPKSKKYNFLLANLYLKNRDYVNAQKFFYRTYELDNHNIDALFCYAQMLKIHGNFDEAMVQFKNYEKIAKKLNRYTINKSKLVNEIEGINFAQLHKDIPVNDKINHLGNSVNKADIECSPTFLNDTTVVFTSSDTDTLQNVLMTENNNKKCRKFFSMHKNNDNSWQRDLKTEAPFFNDTLSHSGSGCFSLDKTRFYFTKCTENWKYKMICNLYVTEEIHGKWGIPNMLNDKINDPNFTTSQPAVGSCYMDNLDVIYFISDRPGGVGGLDIWYTVYNPVTKEYTKAANAGVFINSSNDEKSPFYDVESHALYFSSNGWPGIGGLDIFRSFGDLVNWSVPENIGAPLNSSYDDLCYTVHPNHEFGFFTSNRTGSIYNSHEHCCDDIFSFTKIKNENIPFTAKISVHDISKQFNQSDFQQSDSLQFIENIKGKTASLFLTEGTAEPIFLAKKIINENGNFEFNLVKNKTYKIFIEESNLAENSIAFNTLGDSVSSIDLGIVAMQIIPENPILLQSILYYFDVATLSDSAKLYLDTTLVKFMHEYPEISVEIYSHTDNKGGDLYNRNLSQKRADNVVKYITDKGIAETRLRAIGLGFSQPKAKNTNDDGSDNPIGRQLNRRTEFKIFKEKFADGN